MHAILQTVGDIAWHLIYHMRMVRSCIRWWTMNQGSLYFVQPLVFHTSILETIVDSQHFHTSPSNAFSRSSSLYKLARASVFFYHASSLSTFHCFRCWTWLKNLKTFQSEEALKLQAVMAKNPRRSRPSQKGRRCKAAAATPAGENSPPSPETPSVAVWEISESDDDDDGLPPDHQPGAAGLFKGMWKPGIKTIERIDMAYFTAGDSADPLPSPQVAEFQVATAKATRQMHIHLFLI